MKNFLFFLLGFVVVAFSVFYFSVAHCAYSSDCALIYYEYVNPAVGNNYAYSSFTYNLSSPSITLGPQGVFSDAIKVNIRIAYFDSSTNSWQTVASANKVNILVSSSFFSTLTIPKFSDLQAVATKFGNKCPAYDCSDSDSDGLCDVCDDAPYDSTIGPTKYVRGYYELNDGTTVATIYSYSATDKTNDIVTIDKKYNYPDKFPGLVYAVGMASYIDEKEFIKGGGRFAGLSKAEPVYTMKCNPVKSLDLCTKAVCEQTNPELKILEQIKNVEENGEKQAYPTEQKAADAPYLNLDKTCDQLRSICNSSCGSATNVKSFGCSENKSMVCECLNNGALEIADSWNNLGIAIDQSLTTTNNYYGDGTSATGGGSVNGVSDDGTGGFSGSYGYIEGTYNYDSFGSHYSQLASKFPFSLRTTIGSIYSDFKGIGAAPVYKYTIYGHVVTIDLSSFDDIAKMIRSIFALGVTLSTILMLIYLYVGIDLRGK